MPADPVDPRWPKLLSLTVHEFRTPMTVVSGYLRMLLKERAGPVSEQQRRLLEEAEKSCARLSVLLAEVSELSGLEGGTVTFNWTEVDVRALLRDCITGLLPLPDREVAVEFDAEPGEAPVQGDGARLKAAFSAVLTAMRRELVTSDRLLVSERTRAQDGQRVSWIAVAGPDRIASLSEADSASLTVFDEWRGGVGLSLAVARRIFSAPGGRLWSPRESTRAGAVIALPHA